jgi:hypothetical protein
MLSNPQEDPTTLRIAQAQASNNPCCPSSHDIHQFIYCPGDSIDNHLHHCPRILRSLEDNLGLKHNVALRQYVL